MYKKIIPFLLGFTALSLLSALTFTYCQAQEKVSCEGHNLKNSDGERLLKFESHEACKQAKKSFSKKIYCQDSTMVNFAGEQVAQYKTEKFCQDALNVATVSGYFCSGKVLMDYKGSPISHLSSEDECVAALGSAHTGLFCQANIITNFSADGAWVFKNSDECKNALLSSHKGYFCSEDAVRDSRGEKVKDLGSIEDCKGAIQKVSSQG